MASDQMLQKWLSQGLAALVWTGAPYAVGTVPFVGPTGYIATPVSGASYVNSIRFYCANDSSGRDPRDYSLEGSNDGGSTWTTITSGQLLGTLMLPGGRNGTGATPLNPMTQFLTEVDFANSTSYKSYRITITNCMEPVNYAADAGCRNPVVGIFVPAPPVWVRQPVPTMTVFVGTSPTFTASATGLGALWPTYQWYQSPSTLIAGATTTSYTIPNVQLAASGASYYCVAQQRLRHDHQHQRSAHGDRAANAVLSRRPCWRISPMSYWRLDEGPDDSSGNNGVLTHDYAGGHNGNYSNTVLNVDGYNPASDPDTAARFGYYATADSFVDNINDVDFARDSGNATFSSRRGLMAHRL